MNWEPGNLTADRYLVDEARSPARREYVGGVAYAMAGASNAHNQVATNTLVALATRLRGSRCRAFHSDTKVRIRLPGQDSFYYPDVTVTCRPNALHESFQDAPGVLVEVIAAETRRVDEGEKLLAYQAIPSLAVYLLVEQDCARVVVFRRTADGFVREEFGGDAVVPLPEVGCELPLAEVYDGVAAATSDR